MQEFACLGQNGDKLLLDSRKQTLRGITGVVMIRGNLEPIRNGHVH